jgi:alpha-tubulin suppressor-like RCC1 family protein
LSIAGVKAVAIALGGSHTCVIVTFGYAKCWGLNNYGQLGIANNGRDQEERPVDVLLGTGMY